jgi:glycosyltransferase involved in cell wall biosynthesis
MNFLGRRISSHLVRVIYPGVDHGLFKPRNKGLSRQLLGLPEANRIILHVGTEEPRKNLPTLLNAVALVQRRYPDVILVRVGSPTNVTRDMIIGQRMESHVIYLKPGPGLMPHVYNASDVLAFPSLQEGFGFPLLEAMASGCPIVASNRGPIVTTLYDTGILTPPLDTIRLANSILSVLENDELRADLTKRALERSEQFSWERCAVYEEVSS